MRCGVFWHLCFFVLVFFSMLGSLWYVWVCARVIWYVRVQYLIFLYALQLTKRTSLLFIGAVLKEYLVLIYIIISNPSHRGLSEEGGTAKELEQQLLLYNIFIDHQLSAFQVRDCSQIMSAKNGEVQTPSPPFCQPMSAFARPLPPLSADVSIYQTPLLSPCQLYKNIPHPLYEPVQVFTLIWVPQRCKKSSLTIWIWWYPKPRLKKTILIPALRWC